MKTIKTKSFELVVYEKGDPNSQKLAIVIPGRLDTKDYIHNTSLVDYLASRGYFALSFDPAGTWESPGDIDLYTTTNLIKSVNELIEFFGNKPTLLAGHSRGGTIAMLAGPKILTLLISFRFFLTTARQAIQRMKELLMER